jgi:hypothetical protein
MILLRVICFRQVKLILFLEKNFFKIGENKYTVAGRGAEYLLKKL